MLTSSHGFFQNFGLILGTVSGYKQMFYLTKMQILLEKKIKTIERYVLRILEFLPFSFLNQKFSYFVFE